MRLKIDVFFDGESDFDDLLAGLDYLTRMLMENYISDDIDKPSSLVFPLGQITISKEPNPVKPEDYEDCDDNIDALDNI